MSTKVLLPEEVARERRGRAKIARAIGSILLDINEQQNGPKSVLHRMRNRAMAEPAPISKKTFR